METSSRKCLEFVKNYVIGDQCVFDSGLVVDDSLEFAKTVEIRGRRFSMTLQSISGRNRQRVFAIPASLRLYNELQRLGFTMILLTGRDEHKRSSTIKNLLISGYSGYERLILREPSDHGKIAKVYKSEKRKELENEGYRIHGNSGDQWSDLFGSPIATRSFKLPNPMYYIA
ncbi:hypothetical protein IFM89_018095 [Coptis chinensis]|uniref:Acid phosphatase n=1 Tax=Coptis chinensis TaxID=261450 RepID=A0A835ICS8_9MAGN|nr:hypothetical protein IFM89_018095 [Coptis chinensis]